MKKKKKNIFELVLYEILQIIFTAHHLLLYVGKVKSYRFSLRLRETLDKRPLGRDPDRSWCHLHTTVNHSW